ncbi:MAG: hypothetical protein IPJ65_11140 [Archangiaceae bacterium]|nr:hypothetical protein [Archangiaceae bacterium]
MSLLVALLLAGCGSDADCTVTTWKCCGCPEQRVLSKAQLKDEEDRCAVKKCDVPDCGEAKPIDRSVVGVCKAGVCQAGKPPQGRAKAECAVASDCEVWCCQEDLGAAPKGKKPDKGCKRCPNPKPAAECLEGKCAVAPRALTK